MMRRVYNKGILFLIVAMTIASLVLYVQTVFAQPNLELNYQGKLTDDGGVSVTDGDYNMRFYLYNTTGGATTTAIWTEEWLVSASNGVPVTNGLFSTMLGSTTDISGVDFNQTLYLGVEIGGTGVSPTWDGEMSPRKILGTVPAAFEAQQLDGLATSSFLRADEADTLEASSTGSLLTLIQNGTGAIFDAINSSAESVFKVFDSGVVTIGTSTADSIATTTGLAVVNKDVEVRQGVLTQVGAISVDGASGNPRDIEVVGDTMYLATTWQTNLSFESYDISDPTNPVFLDAVNTSGFNTSYNISLAGGYAYVTGGQGDSLHVVNISNPSSMEVVGGINTGNQYFNGNQLVGSHVYLASSDTIDVIDVSDPLNPTLTGTTTLGSNQTADVQVVGNRMYVMPGIDSGLSVYDISNPASSTYVGGDSISGSNKYRFLVEDDIAYTLAGSNLVINNISNPNSFTELAAFSISDVDMRYEIKKYGNYLFIGGENDTYEFVVVDVSDLSNPSVVDRIGYGASDLDVESIEVVNGQYVYVAIDNDIDTDNDLFIYELVSVITPTAEIGNLLADKVESDYVRVTQALTTDGSLNVGTNALVGGSLTITGTASSSLQSSSTNPALIVTSGNVGIGTTSPFTDLAVDGNIAITGGIFDSTNSLGTSGELLVSGATDLTWTGTSSLGFGSGGSGSLFTDGGDITYLTSLTDVLAIGTSTDVATSTGLAVYNRDVEILSADPTGLGEIVAGNFSRAYGIDIQGDVAYVGSGDADRFITVDISDPDNPTEIGGLTDATNFAGISFVKVAGNYAYFTSQGFSVTDGIDRFGVIDVSDPANPTLVTTISSTSPGMTILDDPWDFEIQGNHAYVTSRGTVSGVQVIDISDPTNPVGVGSIADGEGGAVNLFQTLGIAVRGSTAFVAAGQGLTALDISDPTNPEFIGDITDDENGADLIGNIEDVKISGNYAYVTSWNDSSFSIIDISDPANMAGLDEIADGTRGADTLANAFAVALAGNYAYVTSGNVDNGVQVFDVSSSTNMIAVGSISDGNNGAEALAAARKIVIQGAYAYVVGYDGFQVLDLAGLVTPTAEIGNLFANDIETDYARVSRSLIADSSLNVDTNALIGGALTIVGSASSSLQGETNQAALAISSGALTVGTTSVASTSVGVGVYNKDIEVSIGTGTPLYGVGSIADGENGATIMDFPDALKIVGNYAYFGSTFNDGIQVIDITDPANMFGVGSITDGNNGAEYLSAPGDIEVVGNYLYTIDGPGDGFQIIDISDPTNPKGIGSLSTSTSVLLDDPVALAVSGNYVYVGVGNDNAIQVIDITDPTNPVGVSNVDVTGTPSDDMYVRGNYLYMTASTGFRVYDISDPTNLVLVDLLGVGHNTIGALNIKDNRAYTVYDADGGGIVVFDITDPYNLSILDDVSTGENGITTLLNTRDIAFAGDYAFVASAGTGDAIQVLDISSSTNIVGAGVIYDGENNADRLDNAWKLQVQGEYLYVASQGEDALQVLSLPSFVAPTAEIGNLLAGDIETDYLQVTQALVADSSLNVGGNALIGGALTVTGNSSSSLQGTNGQAALAVLNGSIGVGTSTDIATSTGLAVYNKDVEVAAATIEKVGGIDLGSSGLFRGLDVVGNLAYGYGSVNNTNALVIMDVSDPTNPVELGGVPSGSGQNGRDIIVAGNYAYGIEASNGTGEGYLHVFDVSNPLAPTRISTTTLDEAVLDLDVSGNYVYTVGWSNSGNELTAIDVSDPVNPVIVGGVDVGGNALGIKIRGSYAFVGANNRFYVYDISDPANIFEVSSTLTSGNDHDRIEIAGNYAYTECDDGVCILDISDINNTVLVATSSAQSDVGDLQVVGNYLVTTGSDTGDEEIQLFDISSSTNPVKLDGDSFAGDMLAMKIIGQYVYAAGDFNGDFLHIYKLPTIVTPTANIGNLLADDIETDYLRVTQSLVADGSLNVGTNALIGGTLTLTGNSSSSLQGESTQAALAVMSGAVGVGTTTNIATSTGIAVYNKDIELLAGAPQKVGGIDLTDDIDDLVVVGDYAYTVGNGTEFRVIDVSNQSTPSVVSALDLTASAGEISVAGNYAYIVTFGDTFEIFDISNPANPVQVANVALGGNGESIWIGGSYAYVGTDAASEFLQIYDIADPTNPVKISAFDAGDDVQAIAVNGNYLYAGLSIAGSEEVIIVDISDPTSPSRLSGLGNDNVNGAAYANNHFFVGANSSFFESFDVSDPNNLTAADAIRLDDNGQDVVILNDYAYVTSGTTGDDIHVIDISDPANMVEITSVANEDVTVTANAIDVNGGYLYIGTNDGTGDDLEIYKLPSLVTPTAEIGNLLAVDIEAAYFRVSQALSVDGTLNVGTNALLNGVLTIGGGASSSLQGQSTQAALAVSSGALAIGTSTDIATTTGLLVDSKDTEVLVADLVMVGELSSGGGISGQARDIEVRDSLAYLVSNNSGADLDIFDISDPTNPVEVGSLDFSTENVFGMDLKGNYVYAASVSGTDGFSIIDISDPTNPVEISDVDTNGAAYAVVVDGNYAYVGQTGTDDIEVFDVSDPTNPFKVGGVAADALVAGLMIRGNYLYGVSNSTGDDLEIFDITDPTNPVEVGSVGVSSANIQAIDFKGNIAYVSGFDDLGVINIADPANPVLIRTIATGDTMFDLKVAGDYLFAANQTTDGDDIEVYDISSSTNPVKVGGSGTPIGDNTNEIFIQGEYLYTASAGSSGLHIFKLPSLITPTAEIGSLLANDIQTNFLRVTQTLISDTSLNVGTDALVHGVVAVTGSELDTEIAQGLVAHYTFDVANVDLSSSTAEIQDISGNGNDADWQDHSTTTVVGIIRQAIEFDGASGGEADFTREQSAFSSDANPATATFGATPTEGNLLVVSSMGRSGAAGSTYTIDGTGWTKIVERDTELTETFGRRSHNIWTKVAGAAEPTAIQVDGGETIKVLVEEFSASSSNPTWTFQATSTADTLMTEPTSLSTGATVSVTGPNLLVMGHAIWRDAPSAVSWSNSLTDAVESLGSRSFSSAYKTDDTSGTKESTVSWTTSRKANAAITVYQATIGGGSGSTIDAGNIGSGIQTISFWVNADDAADTGLISVDGTDVIETNASREVAATSFPAATVYVDGGTATTAIAQGGWSHVVVTDSTGVNGSAFEIGTDGSEFFDGKIDNVRVYDRVLSTSEIERLYLLGASTTNPAVTVTSGYVGVGTTSPYAALTIGGDLAVVGGLYDSLTSLGTDGAVLESTGSGIQWIATSTITGGGGGSSLFTDGGTITYLTSLTDVLAIGTTTNVATSTGLAVYNRDIEVKVGALEYVGQIQDGNSGADLLNGAQEMVVRGGVGYVTARDDDALQILDLSDPENPVGLGEIAASADVLLDGANNLALQGNYAYVTAFNSDAVQVIDISNPNDPVAVGNISSTSPGVVGLDGANGIAISGQYAYVTADGDNSDGTEHMIQIIDISDPANPVAVGGIEDGENGATCLFNPVAPFVRGNYLYALGGSDGLEIMDISDPTNIVGIGCYGIGDNKDMTILGNLAYISRGSDMRIVDISDPANPFELGSTSVPNTPNGIEVAGDYAYVVSASSFDEVGVIDISSSTNPFLVGTTSMTTNNPQEVVISGNYLYNSISNRVEVYRIPSVITPTAEIGSVFTNVTETDYLRVTQALVTDTLNVGTNMAIGGSLTVVGTASSSLQGESNQAAVAVTSGAVGVGVTSDIATTTGVAVFNKDVDVQIGTGTPLWGVGSVTSTNDVFDTIFDVEVRGDLAYVVGRDFNVDGGMSIIDVSDPTDPTILSTITDGQNGADTLGEARRITLSGNYAYVSSGDSGLLDYGVQVIDISNPSDPIGVGSIRDGSATAPNLANPLSTIIDGRYMYVAVAGDDSIQVLDISDPTNPIGVSSITHNGTSILLDGVGNLVQKGNYLYANSFVGDTFQIIDVSDPTNLTALGNISDDTGGANDLNGPSGLVIDGSYVYIASEVDNAIQILDISDPNNVSGVGSITDGTNGALLDTPISLVRAGDYLFVTVRTDNAIQVLDISSSTNPVPAGVVVDGTYNANELASPRDIAVQGNYLYVSSVDDDALQILSLNGLTAPAADIGFLASNDIETEYLRVTQTLYANSSLNVGTNAMIDGSLTITGAASSSLLSSNTNPALVITSGNFGIGIDSPTTKLAVGGDVALTGGIYDTNNSLGTSGQVLQSTGTGVEWVSTSSLNISGGGDSSFTDGGDITYLTSLTDVLAIGTTTDVATSTGVAVYNRDVEVLIGDGTPMYGVGSIADSEGGADTLSFTRSVQAVGDFLYTTSQTENGMQIIDISDPTDPTGVASITDGNSGADTLRNGQDVEVVGNYAYVVSSQDDGLQIIDISNPENPRGVGSIDDGTNGADRLEGATDVAVQGNYAYVTASNPDDGMQIIDISDPTNPIGVGSIGDNASGADELDGANAVVVRGNYAYVASNQDAGFQIIDISDPTNPIGVGSIGDGAGGATELTGATSVAVSGNYAYVAAFGDSGFQIIDISDPTNPAGLGELNDGDNGADRLAGAADVVVSGDYAFVASFSDSAVQIIDISDPDNPVGAGSITDGSNGATRLSGAFAIDIKGEYLYVSGYSEAGIQILSLPTLTSPTAEIGSLASDDIESSFLNVSQLLAVDSINVNTNAMVGGVLTITGTASSSRIAATTNTSLYVVSGDVVIGTTTDVISGLQIGYGSICVDNDGACNASTTGRIASVSTFSGNSDLAETYFSSAPLEPGDIVELESGLSINQAVSTSTNTIIGVVSTKPGVLLGYDDVSLEEGENAYPIALKGRVPVKVSTENGPINAGDQLMLSSIPGTAMKATGTGAVVGIALEAFDPDEDDPYYSDTFINQFTDDLPSTADVDTITEQLQASTTETIELDDTDVLQGQIVMFVDLDYRYLDTNTTDQLASLMGTVDSEYQGDNEDETLFDRITTLAQSFVDGVLSVFAVKTETLDVNETLCVDGVCIDETELQILIDSLDPNATTTPETEQTENEAASSTEIGEDSTVASTSTLETTVDPPLEVESSEEEVEDPLLEQNENEPENTS